MARNHADGPRIYRAVIVMTFADGSTATRIIGPYDREHTAQAQMAFAVAFAVAIAERSHGNSAYAYTAEGHIESAEVVWMKEAK